MRATGREGGCNGDKPWIHLRGVTLYRKHSRSDCRRGGPLPEWASSEFDRHPRDRRRTSSGWTQPQHSHPMWCSTILASNQRNGWRISLRTVSCATCWAMRATSASFATLSQPPAGRMSQPIRAQDKDRSNNHWRSMLGLTRHFRFLVPISMKDLIPNVPNQFGRARPSRLTILHCPVDVTSTLLRMAELMQVQRSRLFPLGAQVDQIAADLHLADYAALHDISKKPSEHTLR